MDYGLEAENADAFADYMASRRDLGGSVMAPRPQRNGCARRVLTTEWVEGCRLDESQEEDVGRLCAVALNAYLCMLLDTGNVDPHPGKNILRALWQTLRALWQNPKGPKPYITLNPI